MEALTEHSLVAEVASGTFCFKNKINASSVKTLWEKLARFVADALKQQKGVLLPNLGTFIVGPVVGETRKKVRPSFALLETRYAGVSQERPKYTIGGRCPVVQPSYGLLATAAAVHRGACQRLVLELMQRLGVHILSGRAVQVAFPGVGRMLTNKAGRIQFEFDPMLREYFELERERVIPEMERGSPGTWQGQHEDGEQVVARVVKGLQRVHLHDPPGIKSRPASGAAAASGGSLSPSARVKRHAHAPYKGELLDLYRLCKTTDRIASGCVPRLQLEQWLYKECPQVLQHVAAATVLELLSTHTYGKTGKHILYKPFLDQLEAAVAKESSPPRTHSPTRVVEVRIDSPSGAQRRRQQLDSGSGDHQDDNEVVEVTLSPARGGHDAQPQQQPQVLPWPYSAGGQYQPSQQPPYFQQLCPPPGYPSPQPYPQYPSPQPYPQQTQQLTPPQQLQWPVQQHQPPPSQDQWQPQVQAQPAQSLQRALHGPQQQLQQAGQQQWPPQPQPPSSQQWPPQPTQGIAAAATAAAATPQAWPGPPPQPRSSSSGSKPYHYFQNQLSPRSRRDFDNFNRLHFQKLEQARGPDYKHRAVTPKVGEDELNLQEYQAMRQTGHRGSTPAQVLSLPDDPPYSRDVPHPSTLVQRRRGSPGPQSQILTLAHDLPPYSYVPGLPTHSYQPQQQPATPKQPYAARQPTPLQRPFSGRQRSSPDDEPHVSQYEIINELDPVKRQQKRNELAEALNREWSEQIREKEAVRENLAGAQAHWPYVPTRQPNDKRPVDAVSRPVTAWGS